MTLVDRVLKSCNFRSPTAASPETLQDSKRSGFKNPIEMAQDKV